jgi:hypothetical protein
MTYLFILLNKLLSTYVEPRDTETYSTPVPKDLYLHTKIVTEDRDSYMEDR